MGRPRFFAKRKEELDSPEVNLTPLIDVVFCILIVFIVIAPLLELDRVELADGVHHVEGKATLENSPIAIYLREDNTIWIHKKKVDVEELATILKLEKTHHPQAKPQLFSDKKAQFGTYQSIKNAAELAGFRHLDVILKPT